MSALGCTLEGLGGETAAARLARSGPNRLGERPRTDAGVLLLRQLSSPIILILTGAAALSFLLGQPTDGSIILGIVLVSGLLGFWQERGAATAVERLLQTVELKATVLRDGREMKIPVDEVVPGDIAMLSAGASIPADCRLLEECDLFVNEAALTGESYSVDKSPGMLPAETPLARRGNVLFLGTHVVSGSGRAVVVHTGQATELGKIAGRLRVRSRETDFERGVRRLGYLLLEAGVREGRKTFANTLKYVFMATSANFGNMFSMAGASLFLPFLPLLPKQILLTNLLTDFPELTIATDRVDADWIERPRRWDVHFIRKFMFTFGLVSSIFDYLTFGVLLWVLRAGAGEFRTGWFVESVVSAALIVLVVRARGPFFRSPPSRPLLAATLTVAAATIGLPYTPLGPFSASCRCRRRSWQ